MANSFFLGDKIPGEFGEVRTHFTGHIHVLAFNSSRSVDISSHAVLFRVLSLVATLTDIGYNFQKSLTFKIMTGYVAFLQDVFEGRLSYIFSDQHFPSPVTQE